MSMNRYCTVSVVLNTHPGYGRFMHRALTSILKQTYQDFEVMVVSDGPFDQAATEALVKYEPMFEERGVYLNAIALEEPSGGQSKPKNVGMHWTKGDYLTYLDGDNEMRPRKLEVLVEAMEMGTVWPDLVYGRRNYVHDDDSPRTVNGVPLPTGESHFLPWCDEVAVPFSQSWRNNMIDTGDFMVSRGALWMLDKHTGMLWNEDQRRAADYELVCRGIFLGGWRPIAVDEVVQDYHWHGGGQLQLTRPMVEGVGSKTL